MVNWFLTEYPDLFKVANQTSDREANSRAQASVAHSRTVQKVKSNRKIKWLKEVEARARQAERIKFDLSDETRLKGRGEFTKVKTSYLGTRIQT